MKGQKCIQQNKKLNLKGGLSALLFLLGSLQVVLSDDAAISCFSHCSRWQEEQPRRRQRYGGPGGVVLMTMLWRKRRMVERSRADEAETPCSCFYSMKPGLVPVSESLIGWLLEEGKAEAGPPRQRGGCSCGAGSEEVGRQEAYQQSSFGLFCLMLTLQVLHTCWGPICLRLPETSTPLWGKEVTEKPLEGDHHSCHKALSSLPSWIDENVTPHPLYAHFPSLLLPFLNPLCSSHPAGSSLSNPPHRLCSERPGCECSAMVQITSFVWEVECYTGPTNLAHRRDVGCCCCCCCFLFYLVKVKKIHIKFNNQKPLPNN